MKYFILFILSMSTYAQTFTTKHNSNNLRKTLEEVDSLLPISIKEQYKKISVKVEKLNKKNDVCSDKAHYGHFKRHTITVAQGLLIKECPNKDVHEVLKKTLIHELAHYIESHTKARREVLQKESWCSNLTGQEKSFNQKECLHNRRIKKYPYSNSHTFQNLNFFEKNNLELRIPDNYEKKNSQEAFAVNFEYFITDKDYQCKRPSLYKFYRELFNHEVSSDCSINYQGHEQIPGNKLFNLDPKRVYRIDYLLASKGQEMVSRFGHSMLRIIICSPNRKVVDEKCLLDTNFHAVVSFRANQGVSSKSSMIKGIFGGYPSQLYLINLRSVIQEYTRAEKRDLLSYPLEISDEQKKDLINRVLESFWSYQGDYYFGSNNCASETRDLLSTIFDENDPYWLSNKPDTPYGLLKLLIKMGLTSELDAPTFKRISTESLVDDYNNTRISVKYTYEEYIALGARERSMEIIRIDNIEELITLKSIEDEILKDIKKEMKQRFGKKIEEGHDINLGQLGQRLVRSAKLSEPWLLVKNFKDYGIPMEGLSKDLYQKRTEEINSIYKKMDDIAKEKEAALANEIDRTLTNKYGIAKLIVNLEIERPHR